MIRSGSTLELKGKNLLQNLEIQLNKLDQEQKTLIQMIHDQEAVLSKQKEKQTNGNFFKQSFLFVNCHPLNSNKHVDSNTKKYELLLNELLSLQNEIDKQKANLFQKRNHITQLKQFSKEIPSLKSKVESYYSKGRIQYKTVRENVNMLNVRIADHERFLKNTSVEKMEFDYKSRKKYCSNTHLSNKQKMSEYQYILSEMYQKIN